jgi:hypothetical protein
MCGANTTASRCHAEIASGNSGYLDLHAAVSISGGNRRENVLGDELYIPLPVRDRNGRFGIAFLYNEAEVDRRLDVLEAAGADPDLLDELREFHAQRRAADALPDGVEVGWAGMEMEDGSTE